MAASLSGCSRVKEWDADRFAFDGIRAKGEEKKETLGFPGCFFFLFFFSEVETLLEFQSVRDSWFLSLSHRRSFADVIFPCARTV